MTVSIITKELAIKAYLHGACRLLEIGGRIEDLSTADLIWVENAGFVSQSELKLKIPIWVLSGYGSGDGSGYGSGYGDGSGYGSGYGDGDGSGYGYGDGSGYGDGYGDGSGFKVIEKLLCPKS